MIIQSYFKTSLQGIISTLRGSTVLSFALCHVPNQVGSLVYSYILNSQALTVGRRNLKESQVVNWIGTL